jgi:hypothetical protein
VSLLGLEDIILEPWMEDTLMDMERLCMSMEEYSNSGMKVVGITVVLVGMESIQWLQLEIDMQAASKLENCMASDTSGKQF